MLIAVTVVLVLAVADIALANGRWLRFLYSYIQRQPEIWREWRRECAKIDGETRKEIDEIIVKDKMLR